jgi:hypothetical protein
MGGKFDRGRKCKMRAESEVEIGIRNMILSRPKHHFKYGILYPNMHN